MTLSNFFLSWKTQRNLSGKERRSCGRRGWGAPKEALSPVGRLMSEVTECDLSDDPSEGNSEPGCELGSEGRKDVRPQPQIR